MKQVKSGLSASVKSLYLYYRRLQFIQPTVKTNSTYCSFETADLGDDGEYLESSTENPIKDDSSSAQNKEDSRFIENWGWVSSKL